jgi:VWFA-related protein
MTTCAPVWTVVAPRLLIAVAATVAGSNLTADQGTPPQRFVAGATSIRLDLTAIDSKGEPVTDLAEHELRLAVGKRPRGIQVLRWLGDGRAQSRNAAGIGGSAGRLDLTPPYGANTGEVDGHTWFVVVNHESLRPGDEYPATRMLSQLLKQLPARDRVGVATIPRGQALAEFTQDRAVALKAMGLTAGHRSPPGGRDPSTSCETGDGRVVMADLAAMFAALAEMPGPKTLVFVSGSIVSIADAGCADVRAQLVRAAEASSAFLLVIEPHQFRIDAMVRGIDAWSGLDGMGLSGVTVSRELEDLAGALGGNVYRLSGSGERLLNVVARMPEARYELYFEAAPDERNGTVRDITVATTRPDVKVLVRQYNAATGRSTSNADQVLADGRIHTEVPVRLAAVPFRNGRATTLKVIVVAEAVPGSTPLTSARFALLDARRKIVSGWSEILKDQSGQVVTASTAKPGKLYARAAFLSADGRAGTAEFEFAAELQQCRGVSLSGIMTGRVTDGVFVPSLRVGQDATAYVELYAAPAAAGGRIPVVTISVDEGTPVAARVAGTSDRDRWAVTAALPATLAVGDHLIAATVLDGTTEICRATGVFRKGSPAQ